MTNRVRRVIRDEISCGNYLEVQSVRFDVQIVRPLYLTQPQAARHLCVIQRAITYMLKGNQKS